MIEPTLAFMHQENISRFERMEVRMSLLEQKVNSALALAKWIAGASVTFGVAILTVLLMKGGG